MFTLSELDRLSREEIIAQARVLGVETPERLTRVELADEILRISAPSEGGRSSARGWFGVARELVANVVESGLHLPDAAKLIRGQDMTGVESAVQKPVATVTLAEIYATQRHDERALAMLEEVLSAEPEHEAARELKEQILARLGRKGAVGESTEAPSVASDSTEALSVASESTEALSVTSEPTGAPSAAEPRVVEPLLYVVRREQGRALLWWQVSEAFVEAARARHGAGELLVRVLSLQPAPLAPKRSLSDIVVKVGEGSHLLVGLSESAVLRVALGWRSGQVFRACAVATEVQLGAGGEVTVTYMPRAVGQELSDRARSSVAQALAQALV
jgi:hypothetical protein